MCYICNDIPHSVGCPFYENASLDKCSVCGNSIYKEQRFFDFKQERIHYDCIKDLSSLEILDILEIKPVVSRK